MPSTTDCLIVVDVQNDFLPGGALAVPAGDEVVPVVNALAARFSSVVLTQDWHPADHRSFAAAHPGRAPFDTVELPYGPQVLWPVHCVQASPGAALAADLAVPHAFVILRKGANRFVDSYSAFREADGTDTGLAALLSARGITRVHVCGLATDFCVAWTALDARAAGFETVLVDDASRAIDLDGSLAAARARLEAAGVVTLDAEEIA
ncbi:bifunctional nicotinamidase/pyrazinamidase [Siculibacillus lacustris]|uniref:Nicotinamidase n=1 Tax=Siculibacillus lacustris TaxID=1549641 RepID=A0A4V2KSV7_9HYPH|nr:bifunctional nicotinamidase/pyrazinamidase [Siculibacillus lacustris]TBW34625.1 bifunctional nicotinamidase/pyrazinamidase [Siculibacillus lacustris]